MNNFKRFIAICTLAVLGSLPAYGASLLSTPAPFTTPSSETYLADPSFVAAPGTGFWGGNLLTWEQAGPVSIQAAVSDEAGSNDYFFQLTAFNSTSDAWSGFQVDLSGPATFSTVLVPSLGSFANTRSVNPSNTSVVFSDVDWPAGFSSQVTTGLVVTAPVANEPLILTFTPIPVPEPGSATLVLLASALVIRRRR